MERALILQTARSWVGTPYRHQASLKGVGSDCLGLIRGVWRELYGDEAEVPPPYQPDWYDVRKDDLLLRKAQQYLIQIPIDEAMEGDAVVFRMRPEHAAKHCGILSEEGRMIHGLTRKDIEEVTLNHFYRKRIVAAFQFPGVA